ncbi:MAG: hypothetical protein AMJ81_07080 [Phycisphaerae bacterium SM23_33]|nr:MAG: hypothetical protein AMJ81_07080 [Phycisphaerae bacterium SM23_33]
MAKEYDISGASKACRGCGKPFQDGQEFMAVLLDKGSEFQREDFCTDCWPARQDQAGEAFSVWHGRVPMPEEPRRKFVADEVLVDFFERLDGQEEPAKVSFRFVLALMLMRKKMLLYDRAGTDDAGREVWTMHFKSGPAPVSVVRPQLDEQQMAEVSAQLGAIFEEPS